ncbi:uncharacterized protein LOC108207185 isoform X2 [Daucus carota subsp. sativus]|uniref:uncharacterized protein LOC108207185 isoform X2 n=1 Tax=Daucus carota subsp. sativus TaxID=79200 RepID=UPI0030839F73
MYASISGILIVLIQSGWQPYAHFYQLDDVDQEEDADLYVACHMALGRIPMFAFEIVEYQMPDRVLRQFGILQHILERPVDMRFLWAERNSASQRDDHITRLSAYRDEWDSFVSTGMPIITEGAYVPISEYMHWFRLHSKLRIVSCLAPPPDIIQPRDWFPQQSMVDELESAMRMAHAIHLRGAPECPQSGCMIIIYPTSCLIRTGCTLSGRVWHMRDRHLSGSSLPFLIQSCIRLRLPHVLSCLPSHRPHLIWRLIPVPLLLPCSPHFRPLTRSIHVMMTPRLTRVVLRLLSMCLISVLVLVLTFRSRTRLVPPRRPRLLSPPRLLLRSRTRLVFSRRPRFLSLRLCGTILRWIH